MSVIGENLFSPLAAERELIASRAFCLASCHFCCASNCFAVALPVETSLVLMTLELYSLFFKSIFLASSTVILFLEA